MAKQHLKPIIVWGTCWFDEEPDVVVSFLKKAKRCCSDYGVDCSLIVFDANHVRSQEIRASLEKRLNCVVIGNPVNEYPNKNFGVKIIVELANRIKADFVAVVDPDWGIEDFSCFVRGLVEPLVNEKRDLIIPDIGVYAGRSNVLVGQTIIKLFYPEFTTIVPTPFPGAFSGRVHAIHSITSKASYHLDWGGEWDLVSGAFNDRLNIVSPNLKMINVRHRSSVSKMSEAFQMWRACIQGLADCTWKKIYSENDCDKNNIVQSNDVLYSRFTNLKGSASQQISDLMLLDQSLHLQPTFLQLINMILFPLAYLVQEEYNYHSYEARCNDVINPYNKDTLDNMSYIAIHSAQEALRQCQIPIEILRERVSTFSGGYFGTWTSNSVAESWKLVMQEIEQVESI